MFQRAVTPEDARRALKSAEVIERYPDDDPLPSCLALGWVGGRPLHMVVAREQASETCHIVTVYSPAPEKWQPNFRERRSR